MYWQVSLGFLEVDAWRSVHVPKAVMMFHFVHCLKR